jgi:cytoskeletal protein CcmA (bactofilin family)
MQDERGNISGDITIKNEYTLWGSIAGEVTVAKNGKFYMRGTIYGNLVVQDGGRVHTFGNIQGNLTVHEGAKVIHGGVLGGDAINMGGRLYIDHDARIDGKVRTHSGETIHN